MTDKAERTTSLNGKNLYYIFLAGASKILENQAELNRINVFPVADADTGTNLASTIRSVLDHIRPDPSYKVTADAIALAALSGARGNSGVIFAQFLYGLSAETGDEEEISIDHFAGSVSRAVQYIYDAITHPVEGTMLTVIREWAEYINEKKEKLKDFNDLLSHSYHAALISLKGTTAQLKELARANVVDAGAKGFVVFLEGIVEYMKERDLRKVLRAGKDVVHLEAVHEVSYEDITHRYCTEAMIRGEQIDREEVRRLANEYGDSVVLAGSPQTVRLHVHTNHPDQLLSKLRSFGQISYQKADDMVKQFETAHHRKYSIALVTDSTCDLPASVTDHYQIHQVPIQVEIGGSQFLDKVTLNAEQFFEIMQEKDARPSTSQINETSFINLYSQLVTHYDSVIAVHLSRHFSGTFQNSLSAAKKITRESGKTITVLDSRTISGSLGLCILRIARAIEQGMAHEEIVRSAENWFRDTRLFVGVKNLKYLVRSGRVSPLKGFIGSLLNMIPVITVSEEGKAVQYKKTISQKGSLKLILKELRKIHSERGIEDYLVMHAGNPDLTGWFTREMVAITGKQPVSIIQITPALALHAGIGTVAIGLIRRAEQLLSQDPG